MPRRSAQFTRAFEKVQDLVDRKEALLLTPVVQEFAQVDLELREEAEPELKDAAKAEKLRDPDFRGLEGEGFAFKVTSRTQVNAQKLRELTADNPQATEALNNVRTIRESFKKDDILALSRAGVLDFDPDEVIENGSFSCSVSYGRSEG